MTEGYIWTGQFEECQRVVDKGNPQSMELDEKTLKGHWSTDNNRGIDFFIINDAMFSKLCILGEDVEPCFEGAAITAPQVSSRFSMDNDFKNTLSSMIKELKELTFALQNKGGSSMDGIENTAVVEEQVTETPVAEPATENFSAEEDKVSSETIVENQNTTEEFAKKEDDSEEKKEEDSTKDTSDNKEESDDSKEEDDEDKKPKTKNSLEEDFALVRQELDELKNQYSLLQKENEELIQFKNSVEDEKKDALINSFYMLSDEDKKEVIENKSKYSLDDIEAKLSVICVRKKVNFSNEEEVRVNEQPLLYNYNPAEEIEALPAWLKAVENKRNENN